jgi:hypothetical protein
MIFNANELGKSFKGLISYLETGKDGQQAGRMEWAECRNLPTRDPQVAARMMAATSRLSDRVQTPVYHFSVSFALEDKVSRETMRRVADGVLRDLGLHKHQAVVTSHRDTAHQHMHFAVNTVHPETHRAWKKWRDWPRGHESMRRLEKELGLRQVPSPERKERDPLQHGEAAPAAPGRRPLIERVREDAVVAHFRTASSWGELERGLAEHGLRLRMRGGGMVVTDINDEMEAVKASVIDPSRFSILDREVAGQVLDGTKAPPRERTKVHSDRNAPSGGARPERPHVARYRAFTGEFERLYDDPGLARWKFLRTAEADGADRASAELRANPSRYGTVRADARPHLRERVEAAASTGRDFAAARADRPRLTLKELKEKLHELDAAIQREGGLHNAVQAAARARIEKQIAWEQRDRAVSRIREMRDALPNTYANPTAAARKIWRAARDGESPESIARDIRNGSERFGAHKGEPKPRLLGFGKPRWDKTAARESAGDTAQRVEAALQASADAPRRPELVRLQDRAIKADRALEGARAQAGPSSTALEKQIGGLMQRLTGAAQQHAARAMGPMAQAPLQMIQTINQVRQLAMMVKAPHLALAQAALQATVRMVRGMEDRGGRD